MLLKNCYRMNNERRHAYWALVESYRTVRGLRHRIVAYLGDVGEEAREGYRDAIGVGSEPDLFRKRPVEYAEVDISDIRLERCKEFGNCWLGLELMKRLRLPNGRIDHRRKPYCSTI